MSLHGSLVFEPAPPVAPTAPNRMDVACFVGWVARRATPVPASIARRLAERGWLAAPGGGRAPYARAGAADLLDVPVPVTGWDAFDHLFAWDERPVAGGGRAATYLGAAVRSFFAEGGRLCWVVRVGDPWPLEATDAFAPGAEHRRRRDERLAALAPGWPGTLRADATDPAGWHGVAHLLGLPDVSFVCLPDLPAVLQAPPAPPLPPVPRDVPPERFLPCSTGDVAEAADEPARRVRAPRCDEEGFGAWARVVAMLRDALVRSGCEAQLVAAVPLPASGADVLGALADGTLIPEGLDRGGRGTSFVQLAWPWLRTRGSALLPEQLEGGDGALAGVLARNALARGTWRSAAGLPLADVLAVQPPLQEEWTRPAPAGAARRALGERVTLLGPTVRGMRVLGDVTPARDERWRAAGVHRLLSAVVRLARRLGEDAVFEPSGEATWARLRARLELLLAALHREGALRGDRAADAFTVRCDRTTMTQADLDAGRMVAEVALDPAASIERIVVSLSLDAGGAVAVLRHAGVLAPAERAALEVA